MNQTNPTRISASNIPLGEILLTIADLKKKIGYRSTQTIYDKMASDGLPRPISVGDRSKRWLLSEVEAWVQDQIKKSRGEV
ncbi:Rha family transcriptional regulator [Advenella kashmirensis W13003]|uniref:Rha family transcriptional regulator n=1 Tax=Advenella kashmirensis W13003 TaxID=1424334 RepID=V8QT26_9BURK|nr:AlpA family phage regulatory protein [Advenella kashmirensis]ETF02149.1 Rha family transcriptional regulator [Advenella kashmirensis W13003]